MSRKITVSFMSLIASSALLLTAVGCGGGSGEDPPPAGVVSGEKAKELSKNLRRPIPVGGDTSGGGTGAGTE